MNKNILIGISVLVIIVLGYFVLDSILFDGVKPKIINENGFQANYYSNPKIEGKASVVLSGGGQWGDY